jgi:hypothetical protein
MTQLRPNLCVACTHRKQLITLPGTNRVSTCDAFPDGIPVGILDGSFDHRLPHPNDGGVRFSMEPWGEPYVKAYEASLEGRATRSRDIWGW